jgi:hypothetical protein
MTNFIIATVVDDENNAIRNIHAAAGKNMFHTQTIALNYYCMQHWHQHTHVYFAVPPLSHYFCNNFSFSLFLCLIRNRK